MSIRRASNRQLARGGGRLHRTAHHAETLNCRFGLRTCLHYGHSLIIEKVASASDRQLAGA